MKSLKIKINNQDIDARLDENLLQLINRKKIKISQSCEGNASCGTCLVKVKSRLLALPARDELEQEMAQEKNFRDEERLACQLACQEGLIIEF
jgi:ferredoxin, 2Fe-2S